MELKDVMLTDAEMKACYPDRPICNQNVFSCDECSGNCKAIAQAQLAKLQPYIEKARREERERVVRYVRDNIIDPLDLCAQEKFDGIIDSIGWVEIKQESNQ